MVEPQLVEPHQTLRRVLRIFEGAVVHRQKYLLLEAHPLNDRIKIICQSFSIAFLIIMIIECLTQVDTLLLDHLQTLDL